MRRTDSAFPLPDSIAADGVVGRQVYLDYTFTALFSPFFLTGLLPSLPFPWRSLLFLLETSVGIAYGQHWIGVRRSQHGIGTTMVVGWDWDYDGGSIGGWCSIRTALDGATMAIALVGGVG